MLIQKLIADHKKTEKAISDLVTDKKTLLASITELEDIRREQRALIIQEVCADEWGAYLVWLLSPDDYLQHAQQPIRRKETLFDG